MIEPMNDKIRKRVRIALIEQDVTQREVAKTLEMHPQYLNDLLTGRVGHIPTAWQKVLDYFDLELIAVKKEPQA